IKKVVMQLAYQIHGGNYGSDIALLFLENAVELTSVERYVCADWNAENLDDHLEENNTGQILGWGVKENYTHSESLRMTTLMVRGPEHCIEMQPRVFKKYVTYTSFCAGYNNG
ncbi:Limulus clotting factor C, partial [Gryllus bimaculatus]